MPTLFTGIHLQEHNMQKVLLIFLTLFCVQGFAQSFPEQPVQPLQIRPLPAGMTALEFTKLQRSVNWKRIFAASFIPGYLHFYAGHKKYAWSIAAVRAVGFGMMGFSIVDELNRTDEFSLSFSGTADSVSAYKARSRRNLYLFLGGVALNMMGYAFDWAHGDLIIEKERNAILYKYGFQKKRRIAIGGWCDSDRKTAGALIRFYL